MAWRQGETRATLIPQTGGELVCDLGPAGGLVIKVLDSHGAEHGLNPGSGGLRIMLGACAYVLKIPIKKWRRDYGILSGA